VTWLKPGITAADRISIPAAALLDKISSFHIGISISPFSDDGITFRSDA
jgi:hypothetical protein